MMGPPTSFIDACPSTRRLTLPQDQIDDEVLRRADAHRPSSRKALLDLGGSRLPAPMNPYVSRSRRSVVVFGLGTRCQRSGRPPRHPRSNAR